MNESIFSKPWFKILVFTLVVGLGSALFVKYSGLGKQEPAATEQK
ncbi:MAG TPA: hypothetical protein VK154_09205 [Chitinophagales bacterium]|nr:hypothetical protein [Chitinophagales bacterium]